MSCNGQLWSPVGISPIFFSSTGFIVGIYLLIDKDKYLTPYQRTRYTRSSYNAQYCRLQIYSDALKFSFSSMNIHWNSLASSEVAAETTEEFKPPGGLGCCPF